MEKVHSRGVSIYSSFAEANNLLVILPVHIREPRQTHSTNLGVTGGGVLEGGGSSSSKEMGLEEVPRSFV